MCVTRIRNYYFLKLQGVTVLTLTRKTGESIRIGHDIVILVKELRGSQVRIGISAPNNVSIYREELYQKIQDENKRAAKQGVTDLDKAADFFFE